MTSRECPAASSLRKARNSLATSSKCSPVVGSSNRNSLPRWVVLETTAPAAARCPASFNRWASPPESVGTGWPSFTYSSPTSASGASRDATSRESAKKASASVTVMSSTSAMFARRAVGAFAPDIQNLIAVAAAVAVRAAQIHVREKLHLDVLETVARAGRAAAVAGIEAEGAGGVLPLLGCGLSGKQAADGIEGAHVAGGVRARGATDGALIHHDHIIDELRAAQAGKLARCLGRLATIFEQRRIQHVLHQRGFA